MAESVLFGIAGKIVDFLVPRALEKVGKPWGVKHELEKLRDTVSTLQAVLEDAEQRSDQNREIQVWVEKLKDAFYEAQDVLEEFNIEAIRRELRGHNEVTKEVSTFFSSSNQIAFQLKMSNKVGAVREKIEARKANKGFHLEERPVHSQVVREWRKREETHSFIREGDVIGRDDDKKTVMDFLLGSDVKEDLSILPIVGIGGLGKTALAQCVYNDEMASKQFNLKMWVCVSDNFDKKKIVKDMIACAKKTEPTEGAMERLQSELRGAIDGKRYLLVLDDLWNEDRETWLSLKTLLLGGARGSKILITTRLPLVAKITGTATPHVLEGLSESASFKLLMRMACCNEEEIQDPDMLAIGKDIVRKCYGVPLVVRTIGGLLFHKSKHEWLQFKENELPDVSQREDGIKLILKLSYDHLPLYLKQCFALCSLFPKDYKIQKQTLVDLWMAEGFIQPLDRSQHLEDIADGYFMDLLWRNFFQDFKKDPHTNVETCKMHDLMHDLACLVAGTECWVACDDNKPILERTRHMSHDKTSNLMGNLSISRLKASGLRTFLSTARDAFFFPTGSTSEAYLRKLIKSFKKLRILDLHAANVEKVPRSICKLKHLTYLNLSKSSKLKRLPNAIMRLQNLQTLILNGCEFLEELPSGIRKLVSLRNLDISDCPNISYMPRGLEQLGSLHRLTRFILPKNKALVKNYCRLGDLNGLNNLRGSLCIENLGSVTDAIRESKAANLMEKRSLESLTLEWGNFDTNDAMIKDRDEALLDGLRPYSNLEELTIDGYKGESFPRWMMDELVFSLPKLVKVCFTNCGRCKHLPPLVQLPHLKSLAIYEMSELEYIGSDYSSTSTASFPSLSRLGIVGCEKLKAMPPTPNLEDLFLAGSISALLINRIFGLNKLKHLTIVEVEFLEYLPEECLKSLTSLETLGILHCPRLTSLSLGMRHLSSLVDLSIGDCEELDISKDESGNVLDFHGGGLLHSLRSVNIGGLPKLESIPRWLLKASSLERLEISCCSNLKELPEQIEDLQSLQRLEIMYCPSLTSLSEGMRRLASLALLRIDGCPELELDISKDESGDNILDFRGGLLHSLRTVAIWDLPKLESLPQWLVQASTLERLLISYCNNLKELPEQIGELQSLQLLHIVRCHSLTSLPEGMRRLTSLTHLTIYECPELEERCKRDGGEDWYKIAHIPHISHDFPW